MTRRRLAAISLVLMGLMLVTAGLAGCTWFKPKTVSVPESTGSFHFYIPATWQQNQTTGLIAVYASDKLPSTAGEAAVSIKTAPSFLVLISDVPSTAPVPGELTYLVKRRAATRGWKKADLAKADTVQIGGRTASRVLVSGTDAAGVDFKGAFYLIRTGKKEFFLAALATPEKWNSFNKQLNTIFKEWYWQIDDASAPATATPKATTPTTTPKAKTTPKKK